MTKTIKSKVGKSLHMQLIVLSIVLFTFAASRLSAILLILYRLVLISTSSFLPVFLINTFLSFLVFFSRVRPPADSSGDVRVKKYFSRVRINKVSLFARLFSFCQRPGGMYHSRSSRSLLPPAKDVPCAHSLIRVVTV